jgi:hypothetical protein
MSSSGRRPVRSLQEIGEPKDLVIALFLAQLGGGIAKDTSFGILGPSLLARRFSVSDRRAEELALRLFAELVD